MIHRTRKDLTDCTYAALASKGRERGPRGARWGVFAALALLTVVLVSGFVLGCGSGSAQSQKLAKITLVAPPGPLAIPLAYMAANNKMAAVAVHDTPEFEHTPVDPIVIKSIRQIR